MVIRPHSIRGSLCLLGLALPVLTSAEVIPPLPDRAFFARAWQAEHGLPENKVVAVEQDPDGYLWVGTQVGLYRFDGMCFQEAVAANTAGVVSGLIRAMLLDAKGRLWVAKDQGVLVCLERGSVTQAFTPKDGFSKFQIRSMAYDTQSNIWLSDSQGNVYCVQNGKVENYGPLGGLTEGGPCWLASDVSGQIWFSRAGKMGVMRKGLFEVAFTWGKSSGFLQTARTGGVWLFADHQLYRVREAAEPQLIGDLLPVDAGVQVTSLYEDRKERLWAGTPSDGLFCFDKQGWRRVLTSHPSILSISEDSEGNIWVGTQGGGLNRVRPRRLEIMGLDTGLPFDAVQSVCEDASGTIWVAGHNGLLARSQEDGWTLVSNDVGWQGGEATCVAAGTNGTVYIGTRHKGVICYDKGVFGALCPARPPVARNVRMLMVSENGDVWVGPDTGKFLHRFRDGEFKTFELPAPLYVSAFTDDINKDVWVSSVEGRLFRIREDLLTEETSRTLSEPFAIRCLHATRDGSLWIGYAGRGLGRLKDGRFLQIRATEGLWDNYVSQIISDAQGRLWLAGNRGISYVALKDFDGLANGQGKRVRSVLFGRGEGLPNLQANQGGWPNVARTQSGNLLMSMLTGIAIIHPDRIEASTLNTFPTVIERVTVNGCMVAASDATTFYPAHDPSRLTNLKKGSTLLSLGPGVRQMEVDYTALSYAASDALDFRYMMEGLDSSWVEAGHRRTAYLGTLRPGDYRLRVQSRTYDGDWSPSGATVSFTVLPFFWQTWWFQISCLIGLLAVTGGTIRAFERRRNQQRIERLEHEHAVERERMRIAKDLHDEMGPELTGITLLSDLAQGADAPPDEIRSDVRKIGDMSRGLSRSLSEIVWAVNPKNDSVESFVSYVCHFAEEYLRPAGIRCLLDIPDASLTHELTMEVRHNLFMVIKEALNNVVKHAAATQVQLRFEMNAESFRLTLEDNGCGFKGPVVTLSDQGANVTPRRPVGNGLENMRHRIESLGGHFTLQSAPNAGTRIELELDFAPSRTAPRVTPFADLQQKMN